MPDLTPESLPEKTPSVKFESVEPESKGSPLLASSSTHATVANRIRTGLLRPGRGQIAVALLLGLLGFAAVTQVRLYSGADAYSGLRQSDLVEALAGLSTASTHAEAEIAALEKTRANLQNSSNQGTVALERARNELNTLGILAGTLPATGPGLRITVNDPKKSYRVDHMLDGIEELRDAGAEAIQLNGKVRVIASTSFSTASGGVDVDDTFLQAPYVFDVIGDPTTLSAALSFPGGFKDQVALDNASVTVEKLDNVQVNAVRSGPAPQYASPVPSP